MSNIEQSQIYAYRNWLHKIVCRWTDSYDADDIVQETFLSLVRKPCICETESHMKSLLKMVARRRYVDRIRKPTIKVEQTPCEPVALVEDQDPFDYELPDYLQKAMSELHHKYREAIELVVLRDMTHNEAAALLGVPIGTMLSRVSRGKHELYNLLSVDTEGRDARNLCRTSE